MFILPVSFCVQDSAYYSLSFTKFTYVESFIPLRLKSILDSLTDIPNDFIKHFEHLAIIQKLLILFVHN